MNGGAEFAASPWTRATGLGLDPHEYQRVTSALEPRIAAATVSGPFRLTWNALPEPVQAILTRRVDLSTLAPNITPPLLFIDATKTSPPASRTEGGSPQRPRTANT